MSRRSQTRAIRPADTTERDELRVDRALSDRLRDVQPEEEEGDEVEERRPDDGHSRESTRVETTVAIELAASWKPLMKSKRARADDRPHQPGVRHS
jgi:hypothetical protein